MPTGYTANLYDGKDESFEGFVWHCARAFGVFVTMRDEPDAPIPDEFAPTDYHVKKIAEAQARLAEIDAWTSDQAAAACAAHNEQRRLGAERSEAETRARRQRYEAMQRQVRAWEPPTSDHQGLKDFMLEQLQTSIEFDCHDWPVPEPLVLKEFVAFERARCERDLEYHAVQHEAEVERVASRNVWIERLRESVPPPAVNTQERNA